MSPLRDEDLIRDPAIRRAVEPRHAATSQPAPTRSRRWLIGWLVIGLATGVLLSVLIDLIRLAG